MSAEPNNLNFDFKFRGPLFTKKTVFDRGLQVTRNLYFRVIQQLKVPRNKITRVISVLVMREMQNLSQVTRNFRVGLQVTRNFSFFPVIQ